MLLRHQAGARLIAQYDVNNTYQYIINRDDVQLSWLETAIAELGGTVPDQSRSRQRPASGKGADAGASRARRGRPRLAGVRRSLAAARRGDGQRAPRQDARA